MSFTHQVTFRCDACDTNFMIDEEQMELPPGWLGLQVVIADIEGCVPDHEREIYCHFCTQECMVEYTASDEMRQRLALADADDTDESEDPENPGSETNGEEL